jgi:hypothetical protein
MMILFYKIMTHRNDVDLCFLTVNPRMIFLIIRLGEPRMIFLIIPG